MISFRRLSILAITALLVTGISGVSTVFGDASTPINYISTNFAPITTTISYNYDFSTGEMTTGTATANIFSTLNVFEAAVSAPAPQDPNGFGTFIGTAQPTRFNNENGTILYEQSVCGSEYPTCFSDGTFTAGYMVMYTMRGSTLDQLTYLATQYYIEHGCFGGGSPRFSIITSKAAPSNEIHVYLGTGPSFTDCPPPGWVATGNFATDLAGARWDASAICPGQFYDLYSQAVACANLNGLTISAILVGTDGGWFGTNQATTDGQTFLFQNIQVNGVTRFP